MALVKFNDVEERIIIIRGEKVILDRDVAALYGVETREINQAIKNNPHKFPEGYLMNVTTEENESLRSNFLILEKKRRGEHVKYLPTAFTEKGLYMLATILKGPQATHTTITIVETFAKIRELSRTVTELSESTEELSQKTLMQKGSDIMAEILGNDLKITDSETSVELNFALFKVKHTVKRKIKDD
jgi:phage regulator Rha-like protein